MTAVPCTNSKKSEFGFQLEQAAPDIVTLITTLSPLNPLAGETPVMVCALEFRGKIAELPTMQQITK